jgi:hypothetical protein
MKKPRHLNALCAPEPKMAGRVSPLRAAIANRHVLIVPDGAHGLSRHSLATAEVTRPTWSPIFEPRHLGSYKTGNMKAN